MTPAALSLPARHLPPGITRDRPLAPLTSWKIGGPAAFFAEPADAAALASGLAFAAGARASGARPGGRHQPARR